MVCDGPERARNSAEEIVATVKLTPREDAFFDMLSESGRNIAAAGDILAELIDPQADRSAVAEAMRECEHRGDSITHRILQQLNKSFVTPFDREDIYRLAGRLDDVVDALDEATDFIVVANIGPLPLLVVDQIRIIQKATAETGEAMSRLKTLQHLEPYWIEVNRLENEADQIHRKLLSRLFSGEYEMLQMLKLREVADQLEDAADALEHVAHAVETIAVKES
jgi:predicted phosphate transport protein (TIGR00153 family)